MITYENRSGQLHYHWPARCYFYNRIYRHCSDNYRYHYAQSPAAGVDNTLTTDEDIEKTIDVLANDSDPDNDPISIVGFDQPLHGAVTQVGDNSLNYAPESNFFGMDSFDYIIADNEGARDTASVRITINPVNDAPVVSGIPDVSFVEDNSNT